MRYTVLVAILTCSPSLLASAAEPNLAQPAGVREWIPVEETDWAVFIDAVPLHFDRAKAYLAAKNDKAAAAEIRKARMLLQLREKSIASASEDLETLARDVDRGTIKSDKEMSPVFQRAEQVLDKPQKALPIAEGVSVLLEQENESHFDRAKEDLNKKDAKGAAAEIRKGVVLLKLRAAEAGSKVRQTAATAALDLDSLANKVEQGKVKDVKELEKAFSRDKIGSKGSP